MELRLLTTDGERQVFAQRMEEARASRGVAHFRETRRSNMGRVHLGYGQLYALFEYPDQRAESMMSGFIMHDLGTFPQSYPKPDLTHFPPRSVLECGELWSFAKGAGLLARRGAAILAGLNQIKAILVYPMLDPYDNTISYTQTNFAKAGEPIQWPYCETVGGDRVLVQAMVLDGENLAKLIYKVFSLGFETSDSHRRIRFDNPFPLEPTLTAPAARIEATAALDDQVVAAASLSGHSQEVNGSVQA